LGTIHPEGSVCLVAACLCGAEIEISTAKIAHERVQFPVAENLPPGLAKTGGVSGRGVFVGTRRLAVRYGVVRADELAGCGK